METTVTVATIPSLAIIADFGDRGEDARFGSWFSAEDQNETAMFPNYFAFISLPVKGQYQGSCMCHVFYSSSAGQVAEVLTSISDGFSRTHFAV